MLCWVTESTFAHPGDKVDTLVSEKLHHISRVSVCMQRGGERGGVQPAEEEEEEEEDEHPLKSGLLALSIAH